ncbi:MAG: GIY-YIG nuclease family protein [Nakamurella sp.]
MPDSDQGGVYYLFGEDDAPKCYIGQAGNLGKRLGQHTKDESKDFWTTALVAVSLTGEWTTTHFAHLEWLSTKQAKDSNRYALVNGNAGSKPSTTAPLEADCDELFETISVLLSTLGFPVLEPARAVNTIGEGNSGLVDLFFREASCQASGYLTSDGLLVRAGSRGRTMFLQSAPPSLHQQRATLIEEGVISVAGVEIVFVRDHVFNSPSAAGSALVGGTNNGRASWKDAQGRSLKDQEALAIEASEATFGHDEEMV